MNAVPDASREEPVTVRLLQQELARTNQEILVLTLELENRVESRTAELRSAQEKLEGANAELLQLTAQLEERVLQRTLELEETNDSLRLQIAERKEAEAKLQIANEHLRRANEDLERFAYSASHDLQEPLRMVSTYCQLLKKKYEGQLDGQADQYIGFAVSGAARMAQLITDLLTYIELNTLDEPVCVVVDANESLMEALSNLEETLERTGATITRTVLPRVRMNAMHLRQVFQSLLGNAVKFRGPQPLRIEISASLQGDDWLFSMKDNGIGIDARYTKDIFGVFKRLHSAAEYPGTGMGLAICKRIVERYGGKIWVESQPGNGANFLLTIRDASADVPGEC